MGSRVQTLRRRCRPEGWHDVGANSNDSGCVCTENIVRMCVPNGGPSEAGGFSGCGRTTRNKSVFRGRTNVACALPMPPLLSRVRLAKWSSGRERICYLLHSLHSLCHKKEVSRDLNLTPFYFFYRCCNPV